MNPLQIILVAVRALLRNKLRSFLTTLGIIIGVGAVIAMTAIGAGAKARVEKTFESMGSRMLNVRSGSSRTGGMRGGAGSQPTLTWEDLRAIQEQVPTVERAAPLLQTRTLAQAEGQNWTTQVHGTTPDYFVIRNWDPERGAIFGEQEHATGAKVAVLGKTVVENLFGPYADPLGSIVRLNNVPFEIIGVAESKGQSPWGSDNDDVVFIPSTTFRAKLQGDLHQFINGSIQVSAVSKDKTDDAQAQIEELLRRRHRIREGGEDDFQVRNLAEMAQGQTEGAETMNSLLAGIALVSLLVGGIGIMNIMLVSVTERTREIGLRMAVGAKPRNILVQFMVEAIALSVLGGILGIGAGLGAAKYLSSKFEWPMLVQPDVVAIAVVFSALVGIGFGLYPAYKASRLDPIQALRYE
ncbi:MAG TPA: ABC transporter permease [Kofleriaceae bacterium]|nr:ABC transporter permease [Kofleriaceae bacterium]